MPGKAGAGPAGRSAQIGGVGIWEEGRQRDAGGFVFFGRSSDKAFNREVRKGIAKIAKKGISVFISRRMKGFFASFAPFFASFAVKVFMFRYVSVQTRALGICRKHSLHVSLAEPNL
jgi:hypothetical protein